MDLFQAKCLISSYGNVAVTQKSFKEQEGFQKFVDEHECVVQGPFGREKYLIISCKNYSIPQDEYKEEMDKLLTKKRTRNKEAEPLSKDEFEKQYKALIKKISKRNNDAKKLIENNSLSIDQ